MENKTNQNLPATETPAILGDRETTSHLYDVEIAAGYKCISVYANTRNQAANIARKAGYNVRSVNMVG